MKIMLIFLSMILSTNTYTQNKQELYEYKKYERFDLGDLEVRGELLAPGDISVQERDRQRFEVDLYERKDSLDLARQDVGSLH